MTKNEQMLKLTYFAIALLGVTMFTAFSAAALFHVLMLISGFYFLFKNKDVKLSWSSKALIFLIIVSAISVPLNHAPLKYILKLKYFGFGILSIYAFSELSKNYLTEKRVKLLFNLFFIFSAMASFSGLVGLISGFNPFRFGQACHLERTCGMYGMYMSYGYSMGLLLVITFGLYLFRKEIKNPMEKNIFYICSIINLVGFYFSYARGAMIGLTFGVAAFFLNRKPMIAFKIILGAVLFTGILYISSGTFRSMFHTRTSSNQQRISLFKAAYYGFTEKPFFGLGYRNFEDQSIALKKKYKVVDEGNIDPRELFAGSAHNNFLEHLATTGILGFVGICLFHLFWLIEMIKRKDIIGTIMIGFIVDLFISGQVEYTMGDGEILFLIMFVYSWSQIPFKVPAPD